MNINQDKISTLDVIVNYFTAHMFCSEGFLNIHMCVFHSIKLKHSLDNFSLNHALI